MEKFRVSEADVIESLRDQPFYLLDDRLNGIPGRSLVQYGFITAKTTRKWTSKTTGIKGKSCQFDPINLGEW